MKNLKILFAFVLLSFTFSCSVDDEDVDNAPLTILNRIEASSNYTFLNYALQRTGLSNVLNGTEKYTLFAPSNMVMGRFLMQNGFSSIDDVPEELLKNILLNHVIAGELPYRNFETGYAKTAALSDATGLPMSIHIEQINMRVTLNGEAMITRGNIMASNGIIHTVNRVIPLPTVVTFVTADANFKNLAQAVTREDLTVDLVEVLSTNASNSPAPFTVFAPNNTAFVNLLSELGLSSLGDIDEPTLKTTLTYHVIAETNALSSQLSDNLQLTTLGGNITANVTGGASITDGNNRVSNIVAVDVQANNGVIHVIDKVILPN